MQAFQALSKYSGRYSPSRYEGEAASKPRFEPILIAVACLIQRSCRLFICWTCYLERELKRQSSKLHRFEKLWKPGIKTIVGNMLAGVKNYGLMWRLPCIEGGTSVSYNHARLVTNRVIYGCPNGLPLFYLCFKMKPSIHNKTIPLS